MSAKKNCRLEEQLSSDNVEVKTNPIDILDYDALSKIFMQLPISERMVMEKVCCKWKEACELAWYDIKKFKCTKKIVHCNENRLLTQSYVKKVLKNCGIYLNELSLSKIFNSNIIPCVVKYCKNLTSFEFVFNEVLEFNANDYLAFKELDKLKSIKIHVYYDEYSKLDSSTIKFRSEVINYLSATINEIHLIYNRVINHRPVLFNLEKFKNLHSLTLRKCRLDNIMEYVSKKITLVYLEIQGSVFVKKEDILFDKLVNLEHVSIINNVFLKNSNQKLLNCILNTSKKLRHLEMFNSFDSPAASFENWENLGNLVHMSIHSQITDNLAIDILKHCYNLRYLRIPSSHDIGSLAERALQKLTELKNLEYLILPGGVKLSGETIMTISNNCKKLKHLEMTHCTINPISALDELSKLQHLEYLNLSGAENITNSSIMAIADKFKNLKYLNLNYCYCITDDALLTLTTLEKLETLNVGGIDGVTDKFIVRLKRFKSLNLHKCRNITADGIVQLIKNCPDLEDLNLRSSGIRFSMIVKANQDCENPINNITSYFEIIGF